MIFTRLTLQDFGLFSGTNVFDLAPDRSVAHRRNIILFGGKNGAGKTTILEAVRLCLYGQRSRGARVRRRDYEKYLRARIYRHPDPAASPSSASVALEFDHVQAGCKSTYRVQRDWRTTAHGISETLAVWRDEAALTEFDQEHWEDFVKDLVPPGISQLFFFDGEKIQALADEDGADSELSASVKSLFGLDLGERLSADLSVYTRRAEQPNGVDRSWLTGLEQLEEERERLHQSLAQLHRDHAERMTHIATLRKKVEQVEDRISREGGSFARQREALLAERSLAEAKLERFALTTKELSGGLLPFTLAPQLVRSLRTQLVDEQNSHATRAARELLAERMPNFKEELRNALEKRGFGGRETSSLVRLVERRLQNVVASDTGDDRRLHPVSTEEAFRLLSLTARALTEVAPEAQELSRQTEKATRISSRVQAALQRAPADEALRPLLDLLRSRHAELASAEEEARQLEDEIRKADNEREGLLREIQRKQAQMAKSEGASQQLRMIGRLQEALRDFSMRVKERKISELRSQFRECFSALARKEDLVGDVQIDPQTFSVTFLDQSGRTLSKSELSAGEKQIYAIAVLWALARISGRPLPFLIDTPLGRLDSDHRSHLIDRYFPEVSHQVVILSTDTEIDKPYFRQLGPYVAKSYHLQYDGAVGATQVLTGYFWTGEDLGSSEVESPAA